jgi:hypothetical protein
MPQLRDYRHNRLPIRRYIFWTVTALLATAGFGIATPYVLLAVGHIRPGDWAQFSNEGQAYGGIAAVIGMLAIVGVVASLVLQVRESAANRVQMERTFHADLVNRAIDDPDLVECWGVPYGDLTKIKQVGYVNLILSNWFAMFEVGRNTEAELHELAAAIFMGMPGRDYWPSARSSWMEARSNKERRFGVIMDEEYERAVASEPPLKWPVRKTQRSKSISEQSMIGGLALGTMLGAVIAGTVVTILQRKLPI